jgi:hypothetical protein
MKYLLKESQFESLIIDYLNFTFPPEEISWDNSFDDYGNPDKCASVFYKGNFGDEDTLFRWYDRCWWDGVQSEWTKRGLRSQSPILEFEEEKYLNSLNAYFGDKWEPIFIKWFRDNFDYDINTIK